VRLEPEQVPSLAAGRILYAESCAICHGDDGRGNTLAAATQTPPPRDFLAPDLEATLSPYSAFSMITYGVQGTAMASFETLSEEERWALAFYVLSLRHAGDTQPANGIASFTSPGNAAGSKTAPAPPGAARVPDLSVRDVALATDADLAAKLAGLPEAERRAQIARWRHILPLRVAD
jgi:cytochrome c553